jgi:NYN domain
MWLMLLMWHARAHGVPNFRAVRFLSEVALSLRLVNQVARTMDPFEAWVRETTTPCVRRYREELLKLGANFDSFKRDASEVVDDLMSGGIPRMAARDVYSAVAEATAMRSAPLAVFWDLENLPVPAAYTGRYVAARLKAVLAEHGDLVEFRGYASIGLNNIPEEKRSDLQLSGCHLVDCPHNGRKDVADKMIIVDAMNFVNDRPDGAVLCFITGDSDYAYLLSTLQKRPNCRTLVISNGAGDSMLHMNCSVNLRWGSDILRPAAAPVEPLLAKRKVAGVSVSSPKQITNSNKGVTPASAPMSYASAAARALAVTSPAIPTAVTSAAVMHSSRLQAFSEGETRELIRQGMTHSIVTCKPENACLKSHVGGFLKEFYPMRFPDRNAVKDFLAYAIEHGIAVESGEMQRRVLSQKGFDPTMVSRNSPAVLESSVLPIPVAQIPQRVRELASNLPCIIFIRWGDISDCNLPKGTSVQSHEIMAILMYPSTAAARRATDDCPKLRRGILVDWRNVSRRNDAARSCRGTAYPAGVSTTMKQIVVRCDSHKKYLERSKNGHTAPFTGNNAEGTMDFLIPQLDASTGLLSESSESKFESEVASSDDDSSSIVSSPNGFICTLL